MSGRFALLLVLGLLAVPAAAQDDDSSLEGACGCEDGCGEESELETDEDPFDDGELDVDDAPDDNERPPEDEDPNRPPPARVGEWEPPAMKPKDVGRRRQLLKRLQERPNELPALYELAELYVRNGWMPQGERTLLKCATLDPKSIRPWLELLKLYRKSPYRENRANTWIIVNGALRPQEPQGRHWLSSLAEWRARITRAYREIMKRRPDDVARHREFLQTLRDFKDWKEYAEQSALVLKVMPKDAELRFHRAEALRKVASRIRRRWEDAESQLLRLPADEAGERQKLKQRMAALRKEERRLRDLAIADLELNLEKIPTHAKSALRLARFIARRDGAKAAARIEELESRGFFYLFIRPEIAEVPYRPDTFRLARALAGQQIANQLWDDVFVVRREWRPFGDNNAPLIRRWILLSFPNTLHEDRLASVRRLARKADPTSAAILLGLLWNLRDPEGYQVASLARVKLEELVQEAIRSAAGGLAAVYPGAHQFFLRAEERHHRVRVVRVLKAIRDPRTVGDLAEALKWDVEKNRSLGVAATLEEIGDKKAVAALVEAVRDSGRPLPRRLEAAEALASFDDPRAVAALSDLVEIAQFKTVATYGLFRLTGDLKHLNKLRSLLLGGVDTNLCLRLLRKTADPRVEELLLQAVRSLKGDDRWAALAQLKDRFWKTAELKVRKMLLQEAAAGTSDAALVRYLGELGGPEAATLLLKMVNTVQPIPGTVVQVTEVVNGVTRRVVKERKSDWEVAARALAASGDRRGVRYFNRQRILGKTEWHRSMCKELWQVAAKAAALRRKAAEAEAAKATAGASE